MKRKTVIILGVLTGLLLLAGCKKGSDEAKAEAVAEPVLPQKEQQAQDVRDEETGSEEANRDEEQAAVEAVVDGVAVDLGTGEATLSFLTGKWTLFDRETGMDYGTLTVGNDGVFEYERLSDGAKGKGTLSFELPEASKTDDPGMFELKFDDIGEFVPKDMELYNAFGPGEATSGMYHIGCFEDEDYLYLKEIGNGESAVSMYVLNVDEDEYEPGDFSNDWLFYRSSEGRNAGVQKQNETFYAWAWETYNEDGRNGVWLQHMKVRDFETHEDYTNRKFRGGYFAETEDIAITFYDFAKDADLSELIATGEWDSGYPLMMCEVTVDENEMITQLKDVDMALYGVYDLGELAPVFSYKGMNFIIDGHEIDMKQHAPAATAITDCTRVGDWIIVECHVNPDMNIYEFYNINDGMIDYFEYGIAGTNLIWQEDDLSTAVYLNYNQLYDFWGHLIGSVQEGEIYDLSFVDDNTIGAKCWIIDEAGREKEFTVNFEYEPCDSAVLEYYEYMLGGPRQLRRLLDDAPDDAVALVIVNPFEQMLNKLPFPDHYVTGALDKVVVVSLTDGQNVFVGPKEPGAGVNARGRSEVHKMNRGDAVVFDVTVPEGMPVDELVIRTKDKGEVRWDICQLSGRIPQMSTYITGED